MPALPCAKRTLQSPLTNNVQDSATDTPSNPTKTDNHRETPNRNGTIQLERKPAIEDLRAASDFDASPTSTLRRKTKLESLRPLGMELQQKPSIIDLEVLKFMNEMFKENATPKVVTPKIVENRDSEDSGVVCGICMKPVIPSGIEWGSVRISHLAINV